jgi:phosphatidylinositol-3-phosphatase
VVIVMENKSYEDVVGSREAPYLNGLAQKAAIPAAIYGTTHPSLPNYLALIAGDTFGITQDCTNCHVKGNNLAVQFRKAHISWKAYMQGMPRPCYHGAFAGRYPPGHLGLGDPAARSRPDADVRGSGRRYAKKHDPFMYFDNVRKNQKLCGHVVPIRELRTDLKGGKPPTFMFITPDLCNDMHDCVVRAGDQFLSRIVPKLLPRLGPQGFMVITWDEGTTDRGCCGTTVHGGHIPTFVLGPTVLGGATGTAAYTHYSILRTIEDALGLPRIGHARDAETHPLDSLFSTPPRIARAGA